MLAPILQILKPILQVFRQIMSPFRKLAFSLSRQAVQAQREGDTAAAAGLFGLSFTAILTGVQAVFAFLGKGIIDQIVDVSAFVLKGIAGIFLNFVGPLLSLFGVNVDDVIDFVNGKIDSGAQIVKDGLAVGLAGIFSAQTFVIVSAAQALGADVSSEFSEVNKTLRDVFVGESNSFISTIVQKS